MLELFLAYLLPLFFPSQFSTEPSVYATATATVVRVIDGDTIDVSMEGEEFRVRYIGIDTPEPYQNEEPQCYSKEATEANRTLVANQEVQLVSDRENTDRYDRLLRYVYVDGVFVNQELVKDGYATTLRIPPNTRHAEVLAEMEQQAKAAGRGLWALCR